MRILHNEHHLAAKFGTFLRFNVRSRLYYEWYFEVVVSLADFFLIIAIHQIEMISFIKLFPAIRFFLLQLILGKVSCFCCLINMVLNFNVFDWFCVDMCWGVFLGRRRVVLSFVHSSSLFLRWILFAKTPSSCAPSSGEIWNQDCCFLCIFHLCWGWMIRILGGGGGCFPWGFFCNLLFSSESDD